MNLSNVYFSVIFLMFLEGCSFTLDDPKKVFSETELFTFTLSDSVIIANGENTTVLSVILSSESDPNQQVIFTTDQRSFLGVAKAENNNQGRILTATAAGSQATAILQTGIDPSNEVHTSATVGSYVIRREAFFVSALASDFKYTNSKYTIKNDGIDFSQLDVQLNRPDGSVSNKVKVSYFQKPKYASAAKVTLPDYLLLQGGLTSTRVQSTGLDTGWVTITIQTDSIDSKKKLTKSFDLNIVN